MSNFIPILSSSPPPIDDTSTFDDDWDHDFGGFQSAGPSSTNANLGGFPAQPAGLAAEQCFKPIQAQEKGSAPDKGSVNDVDWANFSGPAPPPVIDADFVAFPINGNQSGPAVNASGTITGSETMASKDRGTLADSERALQNSVEESENEPNSEMDLPLGSAVERTAAHGDGRKSPRSSSSSSGSQDDRHINTGEDFPTRSHEAKLSRPDTQDNTSQDSVTDSGLCSDISPVPKFEEYPDFGDNKSAEVEFSDEGPGRVSTILEQDEGFANFTAMDSCSSDKQSPDRDSSDFKLGHNQTSPTEPEPLKLKPASCVVEQEQLGEDMVEEDSFGQFSCGSGEGTITGTVPDLDADALTPTQSQYDTDNLASGSSSPNRQAGRQTPEDDLGQLHHSNAGINCDPVVDSSSPADTLEGHVPGTNSADPTSSEDCNGFSDFQSTDSQADNGSFHDCVAEAALNTCDTRGAEPSVLDEVSRVSVQTALETSSHKLPSSGNQENQTGICGEEFVARSDSPDSDSEADFKDASEGQQSEKSPSHSSPAPIQTGPSTHTKASDRSSTGATGHMDDEDDEFGDFASETKPCVSHDDGWTGGDNDEDDDWAFQDSSSAQPVEGDGDFDDFVSPDTPATFAAFGDPSTGSEGNENWASFAEPAAAPTTPEDADQSGNLAEFSTVAGKTVAATVNQTKSKKALGGEPVCEVVTRCFEQITPVSGGIEVAQLYKHMTEHVMREERAPAKQPVRHAGTKSTSVDMSVWNNLRDLEKTAALKYTWDKSTNNQRLLHALSIDTRNILLGHKKTSVPIFAANLGAGVLEPSRGLPEAGREGRVSEVLVIDTNSKLTAGTPQDIPPVEFDWSSAGLTNPLDSSNIQLDLDFFVTKTAWSGHSANTATSPTAALENELLKSIEPVESKQLRTLEPLENYLANLNVAPTAPGFNQDFEMEQLSETATEIVARFPSLSFMRAKMLMFPVKGTAD